MTGIFIILARHVRNEKYMFFTCSWRSLPVPASVIICFWNRDVVMVWAYNTCCSHRMLLEHGLRYGLGMDVAVTVCSWNMDIMMLWAWMHG